MDPQEPLESQKARDQPTVQSAEQTQQEQKHIEGEKQGLSKQQLRKLEKHQALEKKKEARELREREEAKNKPKKGKIELQEKVEEVDAQLRAEFESQKIMIKSNTSVPSADFENILITSALPYVNNVPHLGNIIGCVLSADVYARYRRLQGANVLYVCGTDEYGTATEVKALEEKKTPQEVCDYYHAIHRKVYEWFDIGFDYFGRTSTQWHTKITQQIFLDVNAAGRISKSPMSQCYCPGCDMYLADRFVFGTCPSCQHPDARGDQCDACQKLFNNPTEMVDVKCLLCKQSPELKEVEHFFIELPSIQKQLQKWIQEASTVGKWSHNSISITNGWLQMGLLPKCITRDLKWGVPVPLAGYEKKVFYVWFDAPIGYISITANHLQQNYLKWWQAPENVKLFQFMGKDNVPFHTIVFPAGLIASTRPWTLLHHISTTQYLNYENGKFSKRNGTGVFGDSASSTGIPSEVWRYYLLVNRPEQKDSEFTWQDFVQKNNNELLANLGNLVNRVLKFVFENYTNLPTLHEQNLKPADHMFLSDLQGKYAKYLALMDALEIKAALKLVMETSSRANKYIQDEEIWEAEQINSKRTDTVIFIAYNFLRFISFLLEPFMPSTSAKINFLLGMNRTPRDQILGKVFRTTDFKSTLLTLTKQSTGLRRPIVLFTKYTQQQINNWKQNFAGKQQEQKKPLKKKGKKEEGKGIPQEKAVPELQEDN